MDYWASEYTLDVLWVTGMGYGCVKFEFIDILPLHTVKRSDQRRSISLNAIKDIL